MGTACTTDQLNDVLERVQEMSRAVAAIAPHKARLREPSLFNGRRKNDVDRFIQQMETYLSICGVEQSAWPAYASTYFDGDVVNWWETHQVATNYYRYSWQEFCKVLREHFRPLNYREEARRRATSIFQGNWSVYEYAQRFLKEVNLVGTMSEDDKLYHFRKGLREEINTAMLNSRHNSVLEVIQEASSVESRLREIAAMRKSFRPFWRSNNFSHHSNVNNGPVPMEIGSLRMCQQPSYRAALFATKSTTGPTTTPKKLDDKERQRCRDNNLCFKCRQPGHTWRNCSNFSLSNPKHQ